MPLQATSGAASYDAFGGGVPVVPNYIEEVFSTWLYTGNGSTQTITNGIDLAGKGGLVWMKNRGGLGQSRKHILVDTVRGGSVSLSSNDTSGNDAGGAPRTFLSNGFSIDGDDGDTNRSPGTYVSWTFRKQPKFFDVVTWTGDGTSGRAVAHNLGSVPGFMIVKVTSEANNWTCWHRSIPGKILELNTTAAQANDSGGGYFYSSPDATNIYLGSDWQVNKTDATYVAYLFAHNAGGFGLSGTDNVISCGSYTTDGSGNASVTLGYEPQWVFVKASSTTSDWYLLDTMRGMSNANPAENARLYANTSGAEASTGGTSGIVPTATGFNHLGYIAANATFIYIAIRRGPMKVPTSGTSVYNAGFRLNSTASGQPIFSASFPVDLLMTYYRSGSAAFNTTMLPRLTASGGMVSALTDAESNKNYGDGFDWNAGIDNDGASYSATTDVISYMFRRAPGFFDEVCYTGTGVATNFSHNLGVAPELMIVKRRSDVASWAVYSSSTTATKYLLLDSTNAADTWLSPWNNTTPTSSVFTVRNAGLTNASGETYVAYLFASCPGVSKVGSYTGTGGTQTVNCGFTGGARFVLIKRTDSTGDWYVWDSARGIVAGNDPYLLLNSTAAEVTNTDYIDTASTGFEISSTAPAAINANGGTFVFLAIA